MDQPIDETINTPLTRSNSEIQTDIVENIVQEEAAETNISDTSNVVTANVNLTEEMVEEIKGSLQQRSSNDHLENTEPPVIIEVSNASVKHFSLPNLQNVTVTEEDRPVLIDYISPELHQPEITFKSQYIQQQSFISNPQLHYDEFSINGDQNITHTGGKINLLGLLKEAEQMTREKAEEIVKERNQDTPHPTDAQSETFEIQTVVTLSVLGNPATSIAGKEVSRLPRWNRNIKISLPAAGNSQIPVVKNRSKLIAKAMEKLKTLKSPKLEKFNKKANILRLVTNHTNTKNMLLTNKGLFSEVLIKDPKTEEERNMKIWFREEQSQFTGVILPQLDSRPISRQVLSKYHKDHSADRPPDKNFSFYSQPLPRFRGPAVFPKEETDVAKRHKLLNEMKIQREIGLEVNEAGFPVLGSSHNRRLKTAEVLSAIEVLDQIGPNRQHIPQLEKNKVVFPVLEEIRLEDIKDTGFHLNSIHLEKRRVNSRATTSRNTSRFSHRIQTASVRVPTAMVDYGTRLMPKELEL
ncbi:hypothetical protein HDV06_001159 [Boothiomyces sp. JEL0866]|nr:hypothetical protein HDV06_001159 [Boothiomyces sp. JEL0866]